MKLTVIGLGNMGRPIADRLKESGDFEIVECEYTDNANEKLKNADVFVIAVKPQHFDGLATSISIDLSDKLAISIMAGVTIETIQTKLKMQRVVRAMPNLAVKHGLGVVGWCASNACSAVDTQLTEKIFSCMGASIELINERMMNELTAISGSGPAYFFYLAELLEEKAREFGFNEQEARLLAEQTFIGAAKLLEAGGKSAKEWREAVSSKGGVTVEAIKSLEENNFGKIFKDALEKAQKRSEELSA